MPDPIPLNVEPGFYVVSGYGTSVWKHISALEEKQPGAVWNSNAIDEFSTMIHAAHPHKEPWQDHEALHVAVHVRRGDIRSSGSYKHAWIPDKIILEQLSRVLRQLLSLGRRVEVHVMSEQTGFDKSPYLNLRDEFKADFNASVHLHLAGARATIAVNLRDWAHFADADVLMIGGTFSAVPALARRASGGSTTKPSPPSLRNRYLLPRTLFWRGHKGYFDGTCFMPSWWEPYDYIPTWFNGDQRQNCNA